MEATVTLFISTFLKVMGFSLCLSNRSRPPGRLERTRGQFWRWALAWRWKRALPTRRQPHEGERKTTGREERAGSKEMTSAVPFSPMWKIILFSWDNSCPADAYRNTSNKHMHSLLRCILRNLQVFRKTWRDTVFPAKTFWSSVVTW